MNKERFIELLGKADTTGYLMIVAILCSSVKGSGVDIAGDYTRGDFKRAVKALRVAQKRAPQYAEHYEDAISHIRREWLHREAVL